MWCDLRVFVTMGVVFCFYWQNIRYDFSVLSVGAGVSCVFSETPSQLLLAAGAPFVLLSFAVCSTLCISLRNSRN
jgi:hypothetical protein